MLLKTACSGTPRTKEYERALSLFGEGQHPKSSASTGRPTPTSAFTEPLQFVCLCELSRSYAFHRCYFARTPLPASRVKEDDKNKNKHRHNKHRHNKHRHNQHTTINTQQQQQTTNNNKQEQQQGRGGRAVFVRPSRCLPRTGFNSAFWSRSR